MAAILEVLEYHYADHVADMEGIRCRVDADIGGCRAFEEFFLRARHDVLDHAPPS